MCTIIGHTFNNIYLYITKNITILIKIQNYNTIINIVTTVFLYVQVCNVPKYISLFMEQSYSVYNLQVDVDVDQAIDSFIIYT